MALKVVSMHELKLQVLLEPKRTGESVAEVCLRRGISRASFYRYRQRFLQEGAEGLEPRSRRPRRSPTRIEACLEVEICTLRRRHPRWGARRIRAELRRAGIEPPCHLDGAPGAPAQPADRNAAAAPAQGEQALRARGL
jgi:transposase-like protein